MIISTVPLLVNIESLKKSLNDTTNSEEIVASNGSNGSLSNMLDHPWGIFVDTNSDLYVADQWNHRIQLFKSGELNATTIVGNGAPGTISLSGPSDIVLDADKYLFIVDGWHHRIVGSDPNGFRCLVGCSGSTGLASNELLLPLALSFDSYGNMFVNDAYHNRIQKFVLSMNNFSMI